MTDSGDPCYFSGSIDLAPGGSGGGAVYLCQPPAPAAGDGPSDEPKPLSVDGDSMGLVGLPVWLWVDETTTTWGPVSASPSNGPVSVTVTAHVERVEWDRAMEP